MRDLPKNSSSSLVKKVTDLLPDGNKQKPPLFSAVKAVLKENENKAVSREVSTDLSSSQPNSTASEDDDVLELNSLNDNSEISTGGSSSDDEEEDDDDVELERKREEDKVKSLEPISEEILTKIQKTIDDEEDDSTCCDDDFTWVKSAEAPRASAETDRKSLSKAKSPVSSTNGIGSNSNSGAYSNNNNNNSNSSSNNPGKPPRPSVGSLDRRRHNTSVNRHERDSKSRSTHSLKEKSSSFEFQKESQSLSSTNSRGKSMTPSPSHKKIDDELWIFKDQLHDSGNFNNYHSSGSSHNNNNHRQSPGIWEPPPPPPLSHWDPHHYWNYHHSREELRMMEYHRRQQEMYRYGSNGALSSSQDLSCASGCCNRSYYPPPPPSCCSCDHRSMMLWGNPNQRQDTDERLRRIQSEKEALALQVQVLTEQVQTQSTKLADLEKMLNDKNQLLSNAEDLLQREMLSRSSLETQKLELMSAMSELKLQQAALERENLELRANYLSQTNLNSNVNNNSVNNNNNNNNNSNPLRRPPLIGSSRVGGAFSTSTPGNASNSSPLHHGSHGSLPQASPITPKTPPASYRQRVDMYYNSLPRQSLISCATNSSPATNVLTDSNANPKQRNVAFAESEKVIEDTIDLPQRSFTPQPTSSPSLSHKNMKGLRSIFGKIKRSNSGNLEDLPGEGEFKRGGVRATAGARLGWSGGQYQRPSKPFKDWDIDTICLWFEEMGLNMYEEETRKWLKNSGASELVSASPIDIEKELNLKSPLHRKKIVLAIADVTGAEEVDEMFKNAGKLDTAWIMRWLDDVGLPQHKDTFSAARMDGRMLHKLTMDDLANLHVTSCLHVASLKRGIQLMRENKWDPDCLIRRSSGEDTARGQVTLWTAHRVMEWLRVVDLAEYAPNLRGAGVHGALMMFEVKFTAELLADLLSIPPSKTLLRRHLATHFKELLGREIIQVKRDAENTLGFQPLNLTAKIKTPKKSQFSLKRKKSSKGLNGDEWSDFVCPMGASGQEHLPPRNASSGTATNNVVAAMMKNQTTPRPDPVGVGCEVASQQQSNGNDSPTSTRSSTTSTS